MINVRVYFIHHGQKNFFFIFNLNDSCLPKKKKKTFVLVLVFSCALGTVSCLGRPSFRSRAESCEDSPPDRQMAQGNPTLPYKLLGRPISSDTPVLVFVPGFPDRCESFEILASHFASTHSLILACLPDYDQRSKSIGGGKLKRNR